MDKKFSNMIANDDSHEKVFVEIEFDEKFVALISQEEGEDRLRIEFPGPGLVEEHICRDTYLDDFLQAIKEARQRLVNGN